MNDGGLKPLIASLVPNGVMCCEQIGVLVGSLLGAETEMLSLKTVRKRREEFTAGRTCARTALAMLGIAPTPILRGLRGGAAVARACYRQHYALSRLLRRCSGTSASVQKFRY